MSNIKPDIRAIFCEALDQKSPAEIAEYLDMACGDNVELRAQVEDLLNAHGKAGNFLGGGPAPGLGPTIDHPVTEQVGSIIGHYKLLQQIGEGGMGVVYMAEQTEPVERRVALKIIKLGMDTRQVIARFEAERQALAIMDHPHIAKVLDAGTSDSGRPYFVMELVKGVSITEYCDEQHLTTRERLELFLPVCRAVQHAHQKGIIHRDLKPSNVMVALYDDWPVPKVIDFGVAKATGQKLTEKTMFTQYGQIVGTLEYMSPEQAKLNQLDIDTRSDIYSLGVLLYELLTGTTPFDKLRLRSSAFEEMMRIIREEEPPKPSTRLSSSTTLPAIAANRGTEARKLSALIRGELDWIVMKALEKDRTRRYETAGGFAVDIEHYLNDEQVVACPPSAAYKFRKFARRHTAALTTAAIVITALLLGTAVSTWQAIRATKAQAVAVQEKGKAEKAHREADDQRRLAEDARKEATGEAERNRRLLYMSNMNLAIDAWDEANVGKVTELLNRHTPKSNEPDYRGFEWYYLWKLSHAADVTIPHGPNVTVSRNGKVLATSDDKRDTIRKSDTIRFWNSMTGEELLEQDDVVQRMFTSYRSDRNLRTAKKWHPRLWKLSDDRSVLAAQDSADMRPALWNTETLEPIAKLETMPQDSTYRPLWSDFSPEGALFATANWDSTVRLFDVASGILLHTFRGHDDIIDCIAFSRDGKYLASGSRDRTIKLWDIRNRRELATLSGHTNWIYCLAFSPDGSMLASGGADNRLNVWDLNKHLLLSSHKGHSSAIESVAFLHDGQTVATGSLDGTVKIWHLSNQQRSVFAEHTRDVMAVAFSQDGKQLASAGLDRTIQFLDPETGQKLGQKHFDGRIYDIKYSPDGQTLAIAHNADPARGPNKILLWDTNTKTVKMESTDFDHYIWNVDFSPDGQLLVGVSISEVKLIDTHTGAELRTITDPIAMHDIDLDTGWGGCVCFSPDGMTLAIGGGGERAGYVQLRDVASGKLLRRFQGHQMCVWSISFSPDGQRIASGSFDETAIVWDVNTGKRLKSLRGHAGWVDSVLFSSNGSTLFTGGNDGTIKLWDVVSGEEKFTLKGHSKGISRLTLSPDNKTLVSASWDRTVRFWRAATQEEVSAAKW